jgi:exonuclease SbcD
MALVRFVHCADLHLDTPFRGLANVSPGTARALAQATFCAWENVVELAIQERADFLVVAGDVFDSADRSLRAQFRFRDGLQRLAEAGIPSFVAFGNHDPVCGWSTSLEWPDLCHRFGAQEVEVFPVRRDGAVIATVHGISYAREAVTEDLSQQFGVPDPAVPSVAVLHANVGGDPGHQPYSPTTVDRLAAKGFTYWALGHVHAYRVLRAHDPAVVYPGCSQSRQPNEVGARGCCLVALAGSGPPDVRFQPTDAVRYDQRSVDVTRCPTVDGIRRAALEACRGIAAAAEGRDVVVRLTLSGRTPLQAELAHGNALADLGEALREELLADSPWIWLERLSSSLWGTYDLDRLRQEQDLSGDLVRVYEALLDGGPDALSEWRAALEEDLGVWSGRSLLPDLSAEDLRQLAVEALHQTLDQTLADG